MDLDRPDHDPQLDALSLAQCLGRLPGLIPRSGSHDRSQDLDAANSGAVPKTLKTASSEILSGGAGCLGSF